MNLIEKETSYPLSPMQKSMLLAYLMAPESGVYILQYVCTFNEDLNVDAFKKAWRDLLGRHDVLRMCYRWEGIEEPVQIVSSQVDIPFEIFDWQHLAAEVQETRINEFLKTDREKRLDLSKAPVMRLTLFRLGAAEYKLVWTYHHNILDGACHPVLLDELFQFYEANCENKSINLPPTRTFREYIGWLQQQDTSKSEKYWRSVLEGFKAPNPIASIESKHYFFDKNRNFEEIDIRISEKTTGRLKELSVSNNISINNIVQGAWAILLRRFTGEDDIVFGTVRAGRHWSKENTDSMMGLFIYTLPIRIKTSAEKYLLPWLQEIKQMQFSVRDHEAVPLSDIQKWSEVSPGRPLFESIVSFQNFHLTTVMQSKGGKWLNREFYWIVDNGYPMTLYGNINSELMLRLSFDRNLFSRAETDWMQESLKTILESLSENPGQSINQLAVQSPPVRRNNPRDFPSQEIQSPRLDTDRTTARRAVIMRRQQLKQDSIHQENPPVTSGTSAVQRKNQVSVPVVLSATFTAEPVAETLEFWGQKLQRPLKIEFAPYNQVFQQLLGSSTLFSNNSSGINVVMVRFEDWIKDDRISTESEKFSRIEENVNNLIVALKSFARQSTVACLIFICPASPSFSENEHKSFFQKMEDLIASELKDASNLFAVKSEELIGLYGVEEYYNAFSDELGSVPYTPEFYAVLGTMIARKLYMIYNSPFKVIVLDCDQTLWSGICGEDGPLGIKIDPPRRRLQEFMVEQYKAGMLLCLCSKNNPEDVDEVFEQHPEMPLKKEHITASMVNWHSKAENLKTLSSRLDLGLDSFIFIDDNPVECSEVQTFCPEVLTLCLPELADRIPAYLEHVWAFDHLKITDEDKKRTELYQQDTQRKNFQERAISLSEFIAGLKLDVKINKAQPEGLSRIAQLTQRTNQFNLTTIRRSEGEIRELCASGKMECISAEVSDRFGDYGLVGAILFSVQSDTIKVDTFLLSCRAMGRGVEHQMLAGLGNIALERGLGYVDVPYIPTAKNRPAYDFLESLSSRYKQPLENGFVCRFPAVYAGSVAYIPADDKPASSQTAAGSNLPAAARTEKMSIKAELLNDIAVNFNSAEKILQNIQRESQKKRQEVAGHFTAPANEIEQAIASIWQKVLGLDRVGVNENFFDIGGTSVKGVQLIAQLNRDFGVNLPIITLFEKPTVSALAVTLIRHLENRIDNANLTGQRRD